MDVSFPIRSVNESELPAFSAIGHRAFNSSWPADELLALDLQVFEADRSLAAFDGELMVGSTVAFSLGLTVPGGSSVPTAGVSFVAVLPSHRRRGILSSLMRRQLSDVQQGPEPVAALFASESVIYGRFGYGPACQHHAFSIKRGDGRFRPALPAASAGRPAGPDRAIAEPEICLRLAEPRAALAELKAVYEAVRAERPGMISRNDAWWTVSLADPEFMRDGSTAMGCVVADDASGPRGYALYAARGGWDSDGIPNQSLSVRELFGLDGAAISALWSDLLTRDLVGEVHAGSRAVDDPLPFLLADPRRARPKVSDGLWIRLIDLPEALRQRQFACPVDVVIEVTDDLIPANHGRWHLAAGGPADGAKPSCERTTAAADIAMPVSALGAAYLGGTRLGVLAAAGQVTELRSGSLASLSAAMFWDPAPWSPINF